MVRERVVDDIARLQSRRGKGHSKTPEIILLRLGNVVGSRRHENPAQLRDRARQKSAEGRSGSLQRSQTVLVGDWQLLQILGPGDVAGFQSQLVHRLAHPRSVGVSASHRVSKSLAEVTLSL